MSNANRLDGLDLARFLSFVGMVIVNFRVVMGAEGGDGIASMLSGSLLRVALDQGFKYV